MDKTKRNSLFGIILLLITSIIWGLAFIAQSDAMAHIGPLTMNGFRTLLGAIVLLPVVFISDKIKGKKITLLGTTNNNEKKHTLIAGLLCGIAIALASTIQQYGIIYTTIGKSGFLTTLYVVFVPLLALLFGKRVNWNGWVAVVIALLGMFLICIEKGEPLNVGDLLIIVSAFFFAVHIIIVDKYASRIDGIRLSFMQFAVCGVLNTIFALIFEEIDFIALGNATISIIYAGVISGAIGYTLQIVAQKWVAPNIAPLIMCLESVFALLAGAILRHEEMIFQVYLGCALVFIAIILAQIDFSSLKKKSNNS